ncbi:hypothetical protein [Streptomyces sp. NPDC012510]|uniref:hypothetical protein n=1 Tax=Streptomyces sp. NPDC012510 TaxID=3364838 RepID=UPI0036E7E37A
MNAREVLEGMIRTDRGNMTVHSPVEVQSRLDAYRAEILAEATGPENYSGELAMLRGLLGVLRATAKHGDFHQVQQLLAEHERDEQDAYAGLGEEATAAAATATPEDFFAAGRTYTRDGARYVCEHLTTDPKTGDREAWGWLHRTDGTRRMERMWAEDYPKWTHASGSDQ